jgi:CheY-like chemotaxis protein
MCDVLVVEDEDTVRMVLVEISSPCRLDGRFGAVPQKSHTSRAGADPVKVFRHL